MSAVATRKRGRSQQDEKASGKHAPNARQDTVGENEKVSIQKLVDAILEDWRGAQQLLNEEIIRIILHRVRPILFCIVLLI
ncbi:hypothetical protein ERJ75_001427300 [Trypanosoma vivax]|nr:hypothetical protein ERJ75_001427300 [Trypanosoma vivax]